MASLEKPVTTEEIQRRIRTINRRLGDELPVFPSILTEMSEATQLEHTSAADLTRIILKDQALATKILRMVNSAAYGVQGKISTVSRAVVLLGFNNLRNLAISMSLYGLRNRGLDKHRDFFRHSITTAVIARMMGEKLCPAQAEECFITGLIHDIGRLIIIKVFPEEAEVIQEAVKKGEPVCSAERDVIGFDHARLGSMILANWRFVDVYLDPVASHHQLRRGVGGSLTSIVTVANQHAKRIWNEPLDVKDLPGLAKDLLDLGEESLTWIETNIEGRLREYSKIFDISLDLPEPTTDILTQDLARKSLELECLAEVSQAIATGEPLERVLQGILEGILRGIGFRRTLLFTIEPDRSLRLRGVVGNLTEDIDRSLRVALDDDGSAIARSIAEKSPIYIIDPNQALENGIASQTEVRTLGLGSFAAVPVLKGGQAIGAIVAESHGHDLPATDDQILSIQIFANQAAIALSVLS